MLMNEEGHCGIERVYSDPSAAHECATKMKARGSYRVIIEPEKGSYVVTAWFESVRAAGLHDDYQLAKRIQLRTAGLGDEEIDRLLTNEVL